MSLLRLPEPNAGRKQEDHDREVMLYRPTPFDGVLNRKYLGAADTQWLKHLRSLASQLSDADLKALEAGGNFSGRSLLKVQMSTDLAATAREMPIPV